MYIQTKANKKQTNKQTSNPNQTKHATAAAPKTRNYELTGGKERKGNETGDRRRKKISTVKEKGDEGAEVRQGQIFANQGPDCRDGGKAVEAERQSTEPQMRPARRMADV